MAGSGVGRSADQINEEIRALWPPGAAVPTDRELYRWLVVEWAEADRQERARGEQQLAA